ncbi:hypothetical protein D5F01_LYC05710 [Larimichthys crocea]|uniref:MHC class II alpha chain N-terminal domain-containing protein n=1 Tax=Larimichthys crocea TaxID=215358 RepID=A0A6G0IU35_LARCR|nr:hypothetical protein D5F01_LYC05710 [Larimichthys crocea]
MKMMKMIVVLVLSSVLCVSADSPHRDLRIFGCSDSDGEEMYSLDGEEVWYADFIRGEGVDPQPSFTDHMIYVEGVYDTAVANQAICKNNLKIQRESIKDPLEFDPPSSPMIYTKDDVELGQKNASSVIQTSRLEFTPQLGDVYSCTVKHLSLQQPLTRIWDVEVKQQCAHVSVCLSRCGDVEVKQQCVHVSVFCLQMGDVEVKQQCVHVSVFCLQMWRCGDVEVKQQCVHVSCSVSRCGDVEVKQQCVHVSVFCLQMWRCGDVEVKQQCVHVSVFCLQMWRCGDVEVKQQCVHVSVFCLQMWRCGDVEVKQQCVHVSVFCLQMWRCGGESSSVFMFLCLSPDVEVKQQCVHVSVFCLQMWRCGDVEVKQQCVHVSVFCLQMWRCGGEAAVCSCFCVLSPDVEMWRCGDVEVKQQCVHVSCVLSPDVEVKQPGVGPAVFCGLGLTVGLLGVAAGTFFLIKGNECS